MSTKVLEQHIAVFGESGSGKTVMLSAFYGGTKEPSYGQEHAYDVVAEDSGQGSRLHQNYLGMKNSATVPDATKFTATSYRFLLKLKGSADAGPVKGKPFDAMRLVWHDYPGEWFEQDVSGEEARRRIDAFRALLGSHVALLLVDGQRLVDNAGEEERYLKSLLGNLRNSLQLLEDELLVDGRRLTQFPRIWVIALSKADLLPETTVHDFRDLVIEKVGAEVAELRSVLARFVEADQALSVGEDFAVVSSARFSPGVIEVGERKGLDLVLPMAAVLPFERHVRWSQMERMPRRVAAQLLGHAELIASAAGVAGKLVSVLVGRKNKFAGAVGLALSQLTPGLEDALKTAAGKLEAADAAASTKRENLARTLAEFQSELARAESEDVLLRSPA